MPIYAFKCDSCKHTHDEFLSIMAKKPTKCPKCNKAKGYGQVFTAPNMIVRGDPKTFGAAAEENAKRVGKEQMQLMEEADKARITAGKKSSGKLPKGATSLAGQGETPPWRDGSFGIPKMEKALDAQKVDTPEKQQKYIQTGAV
jgi:putative FmdB family regulatory protein